MGVKPALAKDLIETILSYVKVDKILKEITKIYPTKSTLLDIDSN